jgi:GNAT superfamily N-acetyltransferase
MNSAMTTAFRQDTGAERRYATRFGTVTLRPERADDDPFLRRLFDGHAIGVLQTTNMPSEAIRTILDFQYRSQSATHRALFPDAVFSIIESDGLPIGRLIEQDEGTAVYYADFALLPDRQRHGLGTAFIEMVSDEWGKRGRAARVEVLMTNGPSFKLCHKLGFVESGRTEAGYVELRREPRTGKTE